MAEDKKITQAEDKKTIQAETAQTTAPQTMPKKNKKINQMSLKQIEEKLNLTKEKMGRLDSRYAVELLRRKKILSINRGSK